MLRLQLLQIVIDSKFWATGSPFAWKVGVRGNFWNSRDKLASVKKPQGSGEPLGSSLEQYSLVVASLQLV